MPGFVEETDSDIEHATDFVEVRDLLDVWQRLAGDGLPDREAFLGSIPPRSVERLMLLAGTGGGLAYRLVGRAVVSLFGHDPTGRRIEDINNPGANAFRERYRQARLSGRPRFAVQHQIGPNSIGTNERLLLPVEAEGERELIVYVRGRSDANDMLRAVFNASTDSITIIQAVRDGAGKIPDFVVLTANAETARRMNTQPEALVGRKLTDLFPHAGQAVFDRFAHSIETQRPDVFDTSYESGGVVVERQLRLAPHGERLTITNIDLGPVVAATRAVERQRNELMAANTLLAQQAADLRAGNDALEKTMQELRDEIARNRELERELLHLARHDGLTGLLNRSFFERSYAETLARARNEKRPIALCIIDIDNFKDINDRFGHTAGDIVLREVSQRVLRAVRPNDVVGRLGGDEFAVLLTDPADVDDVGAAASRMIQQAMRPLTVLHQDVPISLSAGVSRFPHDGSQEEALMAAADIAVYCAKRTGRGRSIVFRPEMREEADGRNRLVHSLAAGIAAGELVPYYQPLMDLRTGQLIGFEALARWQHPEQGVLQPSAFIEALEEPELARSLTAAMLDSVAADLRRWSALDVPAHVSVNVTAFDLRERGFAEELRQRLVRHGLSTRQLAIEVTETTVLSHDGEQIAETLAALRRLGFAVALDDFGTGHASLSHLLVLPVDTLKIDRSFVANVDSNLKTAAVARSLVTLGAALGLDVVAEGVESWPQVDALRRLGCHIVQGFLISEPLPSAEVAAFVKDFEPGAGARRPSTRAGRH